MGRLKVRVHGVHHGKGAVEVDVDGATPLGVIDLIELLGADDASAVDQDVGLRQVRKNLLDSLARLGCIGDIELIELVALAKLGHRGLALSSVPCDERDMSAARDDALGDLEANALSAARDNRGLAREVKCHDSIPLYIRCLLAGSWSIARGDYMSPSRHGGDNPSPNRVHNSSLKRYNY